jgi:hypothetical protein
MAGECESEEYLLGQHGWSFLSERPHATSRCSDVISEGLTTSVPTQPQGEELLPGSVLRLSCSPGARPLGVKDAPRLRFERIKR